MSHFTNRHYEAVALAMQEAYGQMQADAAWLACVSSLANTFARDDGMFKRECFIRACQPGANVRARG